MKIKKHKVCGGYYEYIYIDDNNKMLTCLWGDNHDLRNPEIKQQITDMLLECIKVEKFKKEHSNFDIKVDWFFDNDFKPVFEIKTDDFHTYHTNTYNDVVDIYNKQIEAIKRIMDHFGPLPR